MGKKRKIIASCNFWIQMEIQKCLIILHVYSLGSLLFVGRMAGLHGGWTVEAGPLCVVLPSLAALICANFLALGCADVSPGASQCETRQSWALFSEQSEGAGDGPASCVALSPPGALAVWLRMALLNPRQRGWNASFPALPEKEFQVLSVTDVKVQYLALTGIWENIW